MKSPPLSPPSPFSTTIRRPKSPSSSPEKPPTAPETPSLNPPPQLLPPSTKTKKTLFTKAQWTPLGVPRSELSLPLTLPTGQTFRWRQTSPSHYTGVVGSHLVSLKHLPSDPSGHVAYLLHNSLSSPTTTDAALREYFNLGFSLSDMWKEFSDSDPTFAALAGKLTGGARVLRQDPVECLFQFLCSSNNNIGRIEKMVGKMSSFGDYVGSVEGVEFHRFPSIERLAVVSEEELRAAGFGYRAKYVVGAIKALRSKPGGGEEWLESLRRMELPVVVNELCSLPGVGPKVAACVALFSLDQHHAIPVDTHVWQIATRHFVPELAGVRISPRLFGRVSDAFVARFGKYAGWAQTVLFVGELPSQKKGKKSTALKRPTHNALGEVKRRRVVSK